jgi:hypothetical protein
MILIEQQYMRARLSPFQVVHTKVLQRVLVVQIAKAYVVLLGSLFSPTLPNSALGVVLPAEDFKMAKGDLEPAVLLI